MTSMLVTPNTPAPQMQFFLSCYRNFYHLPKGSCLFTDKSHNELNFLLNKTNPIFGQKWWQIYAKMLFIMVCLCPQQLKSVFDVDKEQGELRRKGGISIRGVFCILTICFIFGLWGYPPLSTLSNYIRLWF